LEALSTWDLAVIGGGPAGVSAAITAARAGVQVLLLEKGNFPRHKVCGEFVSGEALQLLDSLLTNSLETRGMLDRVPRITGARLFLDGHTVQVPVDPPAASLARYEMDAALWHAAQASGVNGRTDTSVLGVTGRGPFQIRTNTGVIQARAVIDTAGRWSSLTDRPIELATAPKWIGLKAHYSEASPSPTTDLYFFDGGYCGMQPVNLGENPDPTRIVVCTMVRADVATRLEEVFALEPRLLERSRKWKPLSDPISTAPLLFRKPAPVRDGILRAGDAAGFVDPFVGDGMSLALRGGALAAESLVAFVRGDAGLEAATAKYVKCYEECIAPVFRASSVLRGMLALPFGVRQPLLRILETFPALPRLMMTTTRSRAAA
jgi:flavin-dependent dehydrogenase